jgi:AcrR family transcriptional regulator
MKKAPPRSVAKKTTKLYEAHRERQQRRILDAVWTLLDERGIDRLTMAEITTVSGVRASTVYQYFASKDEIVWAIFRELLQDIGSRAKAAMEGAPNALARLTGLLDFMADELNNNAISVRFMAQFDAMYARDWPAERIITIESQINPDGFRVFSDLIREGIADGSMRHDLDPELTLHAVINAVIGAQRRLASLGDKVEKEYGRSIDQLFRETSRVLLMGLRAPDSPKKKISTRTKKSGTGRTRKR